LERSGVITLHRDGVLREIITLGKTWRVRRRMEEEGGREGGREGGS